MQQSKARSPASGFTLIELMIAVAIIGILAAVAIPQYRDYVTRGRLTDGVAGLSTMRAQMERHFQDNRTYKSCSPDPTDTKFTLQAKGSGSVSSFTFTVNEAGVQATTASPWTTCASKWITKRGETC